MINDNPTRRVVNFGRNVRFTSQHLYAPTTESEVLELLDRHATGKVRVVGARHSWNDGIVSNDVLVDLRHFNRIEVTRDADAIWVTVGGGCRIKDLLRKLQDHPEVTVPSLGLITEQSIAGAISTATHGSGKHSLSHYVAELRSAAYDAATGKARIYTWGEDDSELRAARCALGCMGIILSVRFRLVPQYDVAESTVPAATLDDVLTHEAEFPLQQFYLLPHRWSYLVQRRAPLAPRPRHWTARLYRLWWYLGTDISLHLIIKFLASVLRSSQLIRFFFRRVISHLVLKNTRIVDRSAEMLVMEHELFRHLEIEIFVPARHVHQAAAFVQTVVEVFDGSVSPDAELMASLQQLGLDEELVRHCGTFTQHYPITFRRVLPDDCLISMTSDSDDPYYAISFITYVEPREPFLAMASFLAQSMTRLFTARLHWGKYFPLDGEAVERQYPALPEFRAMCERVDPKGVFRNVFAERVLFQNRKRY